MSRKGLLLSTILVTFFALAPNLSSTSSESDFLNSSSSLGNKFKEEIEWRTCGWGHSVPYLFWFNKELFITRLVEKENERRPRDCNTPSVPTVVIYIQQKGAWVAG